MHITTHESSAINELSSTQPAFLCEGFPHEPPADSCILIVDNQEINRRVLRGILKSSRYRILEATSAEDAFTVLDREKVDLIIVDFVLPQISGPDLCRRLKSNRKTQFIPIVILTSVQGVENEINGMVSGADEFLTQPLHGDVVRARIRAMLRNKAAVDSLEEAESILFALAQTIEHRDSYTAGHCQRLAAYSAAIGMAMGLPRTSILALHRGGYLHDIGKIGIPDSILYKQGPLTAEEWEIMRTHPIRGEQICLAMKTLAPVLPIIRHHHERYDGSGYPDGLRGTEIPLLARILQVSDIYDALTTARPYKPAFSSARAMAILEEECQAGWRDPDIVQVFSEVLKNAPVGPEPVAWDEGWIVQQSLQNLHRELSR